MKLFLIPAALLGLITIPNFVSLPKTTESDYSRGYQDGLVGGLNYTDTQDYFNGWELGYCVGKEYTPGCEEELYKYDITIVD